MKFIITPNNHETEIQYFISGNTKLIFKPFISNIQGLQMILKNANGIGETRAILDTNVSIEKDISKFGFIQFKYSSSDKEYTIKLDIY